MKRFLIVFVIIFILTFTIPFISLIDRGENKKNENNELVTIFNEDNS